ncbi:mitochondrial ribosomal protein subunit L20-domain-containing protein [Gorgonomyces haynaldii]|nr:mitochondrial ribosomal protein subunit L20-domain-containing protein [Gorgonomyces haynaldii]
MFLRHLRTFYTHAVPHNTQRILLEDGSQMIARNAAVKLEGYETPQTNELPPLLKKQQKFSKLDAAEIEEMKQLRAKDGDRWTVLQLAKKFNCDPYFVLTTTRCPKERKQRLLDQSIEDFNALPLSKKKRAVDRIRRKDLW